MKYRRDNYEYTKEKSRTAFLCYNQEKMIRCFSLSHDADNLYLPFAGLDYRISRKTGTVERCLPENRTVPADYEETMTIYDVLCHENPGAGPEWCLVNSLPGVGQNSGVGENLKTEDAAHINENPEAYENACRKLGGRRISLGDLGFEIPVFPFFPVRLRFYFGDEEFPPQLSILFHSRTLEYMHYETTYYAAACLLRAIRREMQSPANP